VFVKEIMAAPVISIGPDETLRGVMNVMRSHRIRQVPVIDNGSLVGIITDRDTKRATPSVLSGDREEYDRILDSTKVAQFMTREPTTVSLDTPVKAVVRIFITQKIGALPVVEGGEVVGIVTQIDALRAFYNMLG
jgi:acetoin utilization protein AcuB